MCDSLLVQLKSLVNQIDDGCPCGPPCAPCPSPCPPAPCPCPGPGCPPCPFPYPQVCMLCPPPCLAPTAPKYVKPLQLPCPPCPAATKVRDPEAEFNNRTANFYNNYNVDYHMVGTESSGGSKRKSNCNGQTVDGKNTKCEDYTKSKKGNCESQGCPTGFKPCKIDLCAPPCCDPLGTWKATIQPCPPKSSKRVSNKYVPEKCTRPCCKHWKSKDPPCVYDKPCKAQCVDHPPGIKPSRQPS